MSIQIDLHPSTARIRIVIQGLIIASAECPLGEWQATLADLLDRPNVKSLAPTP